MRWYHIHHEVSSFTMCPLHSVWKPLIIHPCRRRSCISRIAPIFLIFFTSIFMKPLATVSTCRFDFFHAIPIFLLRLVMLKSTKRSQWQKVWHTMFSLPEQGIDVYFLSHVSHCQSFSNKLSLVHFVILYS